MYGIGNGISIGLGYLLSLYICWTYYSNKSVSIVTGIILSFSGVADMILGPLTNWVVNPNGILDDKDPRVAKNVPWLFQFLGMYFFAITIIVTIIQPRKLELIDDQNSQENPNQEPMDFEGNQIIHSGSDKASSIYFEVQ